MTAARAVSVAVPVGIAASRHHHNNNNIYNIIAANQLAAARSVPQPTLPAAMTMPAHNLKDY